MKTKDLPIFKQKILDMLPVLQVDMWKKLEIDSREGSYIVNIMLEEHLLTRRRKDSSFLLEKLNGNGGGDIDDLDKEVDIDIKKKKADVDLKKRADAETKKIKEEVRTKKKADADLKKKVDADLKKEADAETKKIKEEVRTKKKADADLKKKVDADLKKEDDIKKKADADLKKEDDIKKKADADLKKEDDIKKKADVEIKGKSDVEIKGKSDVEIKGKSDADLKKEADFIATACDKNVQNIKTEDINILKQEVLDILPILQADIWKRLDACDCNYLDLIDIMVQENLITRTKQGKFFLLEKVNGDKHKHETKADVSNTPSDHNVQKKKPKDTDDLKKLTLDMLPIAPSDLLGKLDVSNRVCSSAINALVKDNLITRTEKNGIFLLEKVNKNTKKSSINYAATLSSKNRFAPCCGCALECDAATCVLLTEWLFE